MNLIGLSGYARSGKDSVAKVLLRHGFQRVGFADSLRDVALALDPVIDAPTHHRKARLSDLIDTYGWEYAKDEWPDVRRLLQRLGTDVGRRFFGDNVWVNLALAKVTGPTVFTDCRFVNEADAIKAAGGQVWRVHRDGRGPINGHISETALDDYDFDRHVHNDGTLTELEAHIQDWVNALVDTGVADQIEPDTRELIHAYYNSGAMDALDRLDTMPGKRWTDDHIVRGTE